MRFPEDRRNHLLAATLVRFLFQRQQPRRDRLEMLLGFNIERSLKLSQKIVIHFFHGAYLPAGTHRRDADTIHKITLANSYILQPNLSADDRVDSGRSPRSPTAWRLRHSVRWLA